MRNNHILAVFVGLSVVSAGCGVPDSGGITAPAGALPSFEIPFEVVVTTPDLRRAPTAISISERGNYVALYNPMMLQQVGANGVEQIDLPDVHPKAAITHISDALDVIVVHPDGIVQRTGSGWSQPEDYGNVRALEVINGRLLVATSNGVYEIADDEVSELASNNATSIASWNGNIIFADVTGTLRELGPQAQAIPQLPTQAWIHSLTVFNDVLWAATNQGLYALGSGGWTLQAVDPSRPDAHVFGLEARPNTMYAHVQYLGLVIFDGNLWSEVLPSRQGDAILVTEVVAFEISPESGALWLAYDGGVAVSLS